MEHFKKIWDKQGHIKKNFSIRFNINRKVDLTIFATFRHLKKDYRTGKNTL